MTRPPLRGHIVLPICGLLAANALAWLWALQAFRGQPALLGAALLAWIFGLRHAVDADHIAAIDNVVRKLVQARRRAWDCGLFFALGHSAVVVLLCAGIAAMPSVDSLERLRDSAGPWGTWFSAAFLMAIGLANLVSFHRLWRARHDGTDGTPAMGGLMSAILRPVQRLVGRGWHMLPVGFLFGLGFDTATEIGLLAMTARQVAAGLSPLHVLVLPALFAAGMVLIDTADSAIMTGAYRWADREPRRKLSYNIAITALSVFVAFGVGGLEVLGLIYAGDDGPNAGPAIAWLLNAIPFLGFAIVAAMLSVWAAAALAPRFRPRVAGRDWA